MKVCGVCKQEKPLSEFHNNKSKADGKQGECKACICAARRAKPRSPQHKRLRREEGTKISEGFERVTVKCWNAKEGCPQTHDFIIETGDKRPRYVCPACSESGYTRLNYFSTGIPAGHFKILPPAEVKVVRRGDAEFEELAAQCTHISRIRVAGGMGQPGDASVSRFIV